jgi:hypothetical protein
LRELLDAVLDAEDEFEISALFQELQRTLNDLQNNPGDPGTQTAMAEASAKLRAGLKRLESQFTPADLVQLDELGGIPYVTTAAFERISAVRVQNELTPAVIAQECAHVISERNRFFENITKIGEGFAELGIDYEPIEAGEAEIGFRLPREIFDNELKQFADELKLLDFIIRAFAEAEGVAGEAPQLRQLSTSDPLIALAIALPVIKVIGSTISWGLDQWKKVEDIRLVRAQSEALQIDNKSKKKLLEQYDGMIASTLDSSIQTEAKKLAHNAQVPNERRAELENHFVIALQRLLALLERGMTVELRLGPPPANDQEADTVEGDEKAEISAYRAIEQLQQQLVFPKPQGAPLMELPHNSKGAEE